MKISWLSKTLIVMRHEFLTMVAKPSFWIGLIAVPIIAGVIMLISIGVSGLAIAAEAAAKVSERPKPQGIIDQADIVSRLSPSLLQRENVIQFGNEQEAQNALAAGRIGSYLIVPHNYLAGGEAFFISDRFSPFESSSKTDQFMRLLTLALLSGDEEKLARLNTPVVIEKRVRLAPPDPKNASGLPFSPLPIAVALMFMTVLLTASGYMMQTVSTEKETRVMEVLMSSVTPTQLLAGKIMGLGLIGLIQLALWLGSALTVLTTIPFAASFIGAITPALIFWSVIYAVLGYFIYASLMAGLGALMPGSREAAQYSFFILLPIFIPIYLVNAITVEPNSALATVLSLIPFTSPVTMPMRMVATDVPFWQILLGAALLVIGDVIVVLGVSRVFRAQSLLAGAKPTLKQVVAALR
jgi:ABC-2 type transport system permease protein